MNQNITIRDREGICMCVRNADDLDFGFVSGWLEWGASKAEEDGVDKLDDGS
jgi:hypothetical protein